MPPPYKLLISDIDGTLIDGEDQISAQNITKINQFRAAGGLFTLATGRGFTGTKPLVDQLQIQEPVIICDGAILYDPIQQKQKLIYTIPRSVVEAIIQEFQQLNSPYIHVVYNAFNEDTQVTTYYSFDEEYAPIRSWLHSQASEWKGIQSLAEIPADDQCIKLNLRFEPAGWHLIPLLEKSICSLPIQHFHYPNGFTDLAFAQSNKASGIMQLLQHYAMDWGQVAAIGDQLNDQSMMRKVGLFAAVANAHPDILQGAGVQVSSNEQDGVAHFIEQYLLSKNNR